MLKKLRDVAIPRLAVSRFPSLSSRYSASLPSALSSSFCPTLTHPKLDNPYISAFPRQQLSSRRVQTRFSRPLNLVFSLERPVVRPLGRGISGPHPRFSPILRRRLTTTQSFAVRDGSSSIQNRYGTIFCQPALSSFDRRRVGLPNSQVRDESAAFLPPSCHKLTKSSSQPTTTSRYTHLPKNQHCAEAQSCLNDFYSSSSKLSPNPSRARSLAPPARSELVLPRTTRQPLAPTIPPPQGVSSDPHFA